MKKKYFLEELNDIDLDITLPCTIFLKGDLGAGKTTLSKHILKNNLHISEDITSPTYTYYNRYGKHCHFDLYRIENYDEFFAIGGEDVFDNNSGLILVEWPELIEPYYKPDYEIILSKTSEADSRYIEIIKR